MNRAEVNLLEVYARRHALALGGELLVQYEPRNEPHPWRISLAGEPMKHVHSRTLAVGLKELDRMVEGIAAYARGVQTPPVARVTGS